MKDRIAEIRERVEKASEGPWVLGHWRIFDEDRKSQAEGKPHWTLVQDGPDGQSLTTGPFGRKSMNPESIVQASGYDTDGIYFRDESDADFVTNAVEDTAYLLACLEESEKVVEAAKGVALSGYNGRDLTMDEAGEIDFVFKELNDALAAYDAARSGGRGEGA